MDNNVKYGVIHEVGEFQDLQPLSEEDNNTVNDRENNNEATE